MEPPWDHLHWHLLGALQRAARPELRRHTSRAPWVQLAVDVEKALRLAWGPAVRVAVDVVNGAAERGVGSALGGGEEQCALALPVGGVDVAGDDSLLALGRTTRGLLGYVL